jgi:hypothetical protein
VLRGKIIGINDFSIPDIEISEMTAQSQSEIKIYNIGDDIQLD